MYRRPRLLPGILSDPEKEDEATVSTLAPKPTSGFWSNISLWQQFGITLVRGSSREAWSYRHRALIGLTGRD